MEVRNREEIIVEEPVSGHSQKTDRFHGVRWSAVFAGVIVGLALQTLFGILGIAGGLSALSNAPGESGGAGAIWWTLVSLLVSAFAGGFFAARLSGFRRAMDGAMYGAIAWAVSMILYALIMSTTAGAMLNGLAAAADTTVVYADTTAYLPSAAAQQLRQEVGSQVDEAGWQTLQSDLRMGQREKAVALLTDRGIKASRAAVLVDDALQQMKRSTIVASEQWISPEQLVRAVAAAAWLVFFGIALSLVVSVCGGVMGVRLAFRGLWDYRRTPQAARELD